MKKRPKLLRITTVPMSLDKLLEGQLRYMNNTFDITAISTPENGYLKRVAEREGVKYYPVKLSRKISIIRDFISLIKLTNYIIKNKPDIVHTHTPKAGTIGMIAAFLANVPIRMHTIAGMPLMESTGLKRQLLIQVEKITSRLATHILPNSKGLKSFILEKKLCSPQKIVVLNNGSSNGINLKHFIPLKNKEKLDFRKKLNISNNATVFIFIGRIVKDKGINELIEAFDKLNQSSIEKPIHLMLLGYLEMDLDPLEDKTIKSINEIENISYHGFANDIRNHLGASDILILPSYREGFPNVLLQAQAMTIPTITTNIMGCNEVVKHMENGILIEPKNIDSLYQAMKMIVNDENLIKSLQKNTRSSIVDKYSQEDLWRELENFYLNALKKVNQ